MINKQTRTEPISFKTSPAIKEKLIKLAENGSRSRSREMERLIKEESLKSSARKQQ